MSGHPVSLPDQVKGKTTVLVIGFSRGSSAPTSEWARRLKADFAGSPDFALFRLAFLEEVPHIFRRVAIAGVARSASLDDQDTVVSVFESEASFKHLLAYSKPDDAYILVLDRNAVICLVSNGNVESEYAAVRRQVSQLIGNRPSPPSK